MEPKSPTEHPTTPVDESDGQRPVPPDVADVTTIMDTVRILFRAIRVNNVDIERRMGISLAQLFVLEQLATKPMSSVNELAERTRTHQSSVSVVVRRLVEHGLVRKRTSRADARRVELSLTDAGRTLLATVPPTFQSRLVAGLNELPPEQVHGIAAGLSAWLRACGLEDPAPPMFFEEEPRNGPALARRGAPKAREDGGEER